MEEKAAEKVTVELGGTYVSSEKVILVSHFLKEASSENATAISIDGKVYDCEEGKIPQEALAKVFSASEIAYVSPYEECGEKLEFRENGFRLEVHLGSWFYYAAWVVDYESGKARYVGTLDGDLFRPPPPWLIEALGEINRKKLAKESAQPEEDGIQPSL